MNDKFNTFRKITEYFQENQDYRVRIVDRGGSIVVLSPHGGRIEPGTSELVRAIAGDNLSYYLFERLMPASCESEKMHIPSTKFDDPRCIDMVRKYQTTLAIHGCKGENKIIYAGGRDIYLRKLLIEALGKKGYPIEPGTGLYSGICSLNICNRTAMGKGVQMEISNGMRRLLFDQWKTRKGRKSTTDLFDKLVSDIRDVITREKIYGDL